MSIVSGMPSNHLILCRPLLLLPSVFPSIRVFSSELAPLQVSIYTNGRDVSVRTLNRHTHGGSIEFSPTRRVLEIHTHADGVQDGHHHL